MRDFRLRNELTSAFKAYAIQALRCCACWFSNKAEQSMQSEPSTRCLCVKQATTVPILLLQQTRRSELVGRAGGGCYSKPRFMITFFWVAYCLVGPLFCLYSPSPLASEITTNRHTTRSWYVPHECLGNDFEALPFYPYLPVAR